MRHVGVGFACSLLALPRRLVVRAEPTLDRLACRRCDDRR
jgi:hypothetical protein